MTQKHWQGFGRELVDSFRLSEAPLHGPASWRWGFRRVTAPGGCTASEFWRRAIKVRLDARLPA